jgi:hypothetical protein
MVHAICAPLATRIVMKSLSQITPLHSTSGTRRSSEVRLRACPAARICLASFIATSVLYLLAQCQSGHEEQTAAEFRASGCRSRGEAWPVRGHQCYHLTQASLAFQASPVPPKVG